MPKHIAENKEKRVLLICESPNKIRTLKEILPKNFIVQASAGHITHIADSGEFNMGIDTKNNFKANYKIVEGKRDIVKKLKEQVSLADEVILFTDGDREGEAIAYHLMEELKIPKSKYKRAAVHEITKKAVMKALDETRDLDYDLVAAAVSREKADKIIGYRLSSIARDNVGARSVGRCQSAGLKLIAMREDEINAFISEKYFDLYLNFTKNNRDFRAKYIGTADKEIKNLPSLDACKAVSDACKDGDYKVINIEHKDSIERPKPPFTTSTFQQEVSKKLGISVKYAMDCAQKLFEGIDVGGNHVSLITYIRTDSSDISKEFQDAAKDFINKINPDVYQGQGKIKNSQLAQEGHECIRPVDINMTPEKLKRLLNNDQLVKIYTLIWQRAVASLCKPAIIANTIYTIENNSQLFSMTSKELKFDGYRKVYNYNDEKEDPDLVTETFVVNEMLKNATLEAIEKETKPPARFDESTFIKELDKQGIGRPSTYATILQVLLDERRGYCVVDDKRIKPTALGMKLSKFLDEAFPNVISIKYTAELEKELDLIAKGQMDSINFLSAFYANLEESIAKVSPSGNTEKICPECGSPMRICKGKYGLFYGCSAYPKCKHLESMKKK